MAKRTLFLLAALAASPVAAQSSVMPDSLRNSWVFAVGGTLASVLVLAGAAALAGGVFGSNEPD